MKIIISQVLFLAGPALRMGLFPDQDVVKETINGSSHGFVIIRGEGPSFTLSKASSKRRAFAMRCRPLDVFSH